MSAFGGEADITISRQLVKDFYFRFDPQRTLASEHTYLVSDVLKERNKLKEPPATNSEVAIKPRVCMYGD
jgi:hypothetical protein